MCCWSSNPTVRTSQFSPDKVKMHFKRYEYLNHDLSEAVLIVLFWILNKNTEHTWIILLSSICFVDMVPLRCRLMAGFSFRCLGSLLTEIKIQLFKKTFWFPLAHIYKFHFLLEQLCSSFYIPHIHVNFFPTYFHFSILLFPSFLGKRQTEHRK